MVPCLEGDSGFRFRSPPNLLGRCTMAGMNEHVTLGVGPYGLPQGQIGAVREVLAKARGRIGWRTCRAGLPC